MLKADDEVPPAHELPTIRFRPYISYSEDFGWYVFLHCNTPEGWGTYVTIERHTWRELFDLTFDLVTQQHGTQFPWRRLPRK